MEQLGALLEKMDRERDRLKQLVNEMEKVFRDSEFAHRKRVQETISATSMGSISVKKGGEKTMLESLERIEAMWRFYGEETSACEVLFGLCREAASYPAETKKKKRSNESGEEIAKSARAFLEVRRKADLERY
jgi:regulator of replication initiation timing